MTSMLSQRVDRARTAGPLETTQLLARAIQDQVAVELSADDGRTLFRGARFTRQEGASLFLTADGRDEAVFERLAGSACVEVTFQSLQGRVSFTAKCGLRPSDSAGGTWRVERPTVATLTERRRHPRRRLRSVVEIRLCSAAGGENVEIDAALLNLSVSGMACRVTAAEIERLNMPEGLRAVFRVAEDDEPFDLDVRVVSVTEGGSTGNCVLGLEFVRNDRLLANRARLGSAVDRPKTMEE